jgi:geranyl-CoA carboxylase alpha subunit
MGLTTVAVYSTADADAEHVRLADRAVCIGEAAPAASYLRVDAILQAARQAGADAIHPGYGFLSENPEFALACEQAGIVFVGPSAQAIRDMGDKAAAKTLMEQAGVPCVPGYQGQDQSAGTLRAQADRISYPLMIKATAGGGGRGMRLVAHAQEFDAALSAAKSEAMTAFAMTWCCWKRRSPIRAMSRFRSWRTATGMSSTAASGIVRCSGGTRN